MSIVHGWLLQERVGGAAAPPQLRELLRACEAVSAEAVGLGAWPPAPEAEGGSPPPATG